MSIPPPHESPENGTARDETPYGAGPTEPDADRTLRRASASLIFGVLALASMTVTAPLAMFAMLATYPSNGPSEMPWVTPLVFFSLPLLCALPALVLAILVLNRSSQSSPGRSAAAVALCIAGLVIALALGPALDQLGKL